MTVNYTIDLGQIVQLLVIVGAVVGAHYSLKGSLAVFGARLEALEERLRLVIATVTERMGKHEDAITKVTGDLQRVIGRMETK